MKTKIHTERKRSMAFMIISAQKYEAIENRITGLPYQNTDGWYPSLEELEKYIGKDSQDAEDAQYMLWICLTTPREIQNNEENKPAKKWIWDFISDFYEIQGGVNQLEA